MLALWRWHSESTCSHSMVCQILRVYCDTRHFPWQMSYYDTKLFNCNGIAVINFTQVRHAHKFSTRCRVPNMLADMVPTNTHFLVLNQRHSVLCNDSKIMIVWFKFIVFNFSSPHPIIHEYSSPWKFIPQNFVSMKFVHLQYLHIYAKSIFQGYPSLSPPSTCTCTICSVANTCLLHSLPPHLLSRHSRWIPWSRVVRTAAEEQSSCSM